jgi:octaprenyl-diphosphate synthase
MGDWLYMSAFETSLHERSLQILDILTTLTRKMTEGEIVQLTMLGRTDVTEAEYFDLLKRKTAYLFSACCEIGAILANANKKQTNALAEYGLNLGMAFQLADDLLDFTAEQPTLGKASGADLLEGKMTYPVIQLAHQHPEIKTTLGTVMKSGNYDSYSRADLTRALTDAGALEMTRQKAHQYAAAAIKNLAELSDSEYSEALSRIPSIMVDRDK